ncbi:MAG: hypothetical protein HZA51_18140 [Planctomycetes bacterium]|nr:hypothetical protein [Planctomycetota bacterium]
MSVRAIKSRVPRVRAGGARRLGVGRAAALLEVVIALSILLLGMAMVGMAFRNGELYVDRAEQTARAIQMSERLLGELSSGITVIGEKEATGTFGDEYPPDMCWRLALTSSDQLPGLLNFEIEIFSGAPESDESQRKTILRTYAQQAIFVPLNMQRDFGMTGEQLEQLTAAIPGGAALFDPTSFDPRAIGRMDMDMLKELLPILMQAFGGQAVAENLGDIMKAVQTGDTSGLQDLAQQAQQGGQGATNPPPSGQPSRNPTGQPPRNPSGPPQRPTDVPKRPTGGGRR